MPSARLPVTLSLLLIFVVFQMSVLFLLLQSLSKDHSTTLNAPHFASSIHDVWAVAAKDRNHTGTDDHRSKGKEGDKSLLFLTTTTSKKEPNTDRAKEPSPATLTTKKNVEPLLKILKQAGYDLQDKKLFTPETMASLPDFDEVTNFYGPPVILGLETCQTFRNTIPPNERVVAIAGMFNSGTNLLSALLHQNCINSNTTLMQAMWQVPWGKHFPAEYRGVHFVPSETPLNVSHVLPVVTIRDPYTWMQSMCRQNYAAQFDHAKESCPNLIPYPEDVRVHPRYAKKKYMPVVVKYDKAVKVQYPSLGHLWNEWYLTHLHPNETAPSLPESAAGALDAKTPNQPPPSSPYPRLMVRMEDVIFRAEQVVPKLCECAGFDTKPVLNYEAKIANNNPSVEKQGLISGLIRSVIKYGNITNRKIGYPDFELQAAKDILDPTLMKWFQYKYEPVGNVKNE